MPRLTAPWIESPTSQAVMEALGEGYFVGGCVRNALLGEAISDIDIATPLTPSDVIERIEGAGMKAVPTGLAHGTVTAVHEGQPVEVTTFRADVATDGRRAKVVFTTEMAVDARRRDFTMNALYADRTGEVLDPIGGLGDLAARRVRFIGDPEQRIREDYLRILRFFRFHAWYGEDGLDPEGLAASAALAEGLDHLARERIGAEMRKLLAASDPAPAVASMASAGILARCLPSADCAILAPLVHVEALWGAAPDWRTRLAALGNGDWTAALRLSRAEVDHLGRVRDAVGEDDPACAAYHAGAAPARAAVLVRAASGIEPPAGWEAAIDRGAKAVCPLDAQDLMAAGWIPGPALGAALARAETAWVESGFALGKLALLQIAGDPAAYRDSQS